MDLKAMSSTDNRNNNKISYKCIECGRGYGTVRDLMAHHGTHTGEYPYVCEYCHKGYKCKLNLVNHINLHLGEGHQCDKCKKIYPSAFLLKQHKRFHMTEKPFACKVCGKAYKIVEALRTHTKQEHGSSLYSCPLCRKKLCSNKGLKLHLKNHKLQNLSCTYCSRTYKCRKGLQRHLMVHELTIEKLLTCHECGLRFLYADRLKSHIEQRHSQVAKNKCIYCGVCIESQEALHDHVAEHKKTKPAACLICGGLLLRRHVHKDWCFKPNVCCPRCTAKFRYPAELLKHAHVHGDDPAELKWECDVCGRYFMCRRKYETHMVNPHGVSVGAVITDFKCNSCNKDFKNSSDLKEHIKTHVHEIKKDNSYLCEDCGKLCTTLSKLNYHRRRHVSTNLFPCLYCSDVFNANAHMQLHMKVHMGHLGTFRCHWCDMNFRKKISRLLHVKAHCQDGDDVCMKCLLAFPTEELFAAHNDSHSLPYKCNKCGEQFHGVDEIKGHVEQIHCSKLFLCGRCNLGLLSAMNLEEHEDTHMQEDAAEAEKFKSKLSKSKNIKAIPVDDSIKKVPIPKLKTYCTCMVCNPSRARYIDPKFGGPTENTENQEKSNNAANSSSAPFAAEKHVKLVNTTMLKKINEALAVLKVQKNPSSKSTVMPPSPQANELPTLSRSQELQSVIHTATIKKVVLTLPSKKNSVVDPLRSETVASCTNPKFNPTAKVDPTLEPVEDPNSPAALHPEIDNSTIVPDITESSNVTYVKKEPQLSLPGDRPLLALFFELLVRVLGKEHVQSLSYAIMADVKTFLQSFLPGVEVNVKEIKTEDTVWLFIQSMVRLFGDENDELDFDYALNDLDPKSLVQEMLRCIDGNS